MIKPNAKITEDPALVNRSMFRRDPESGRIISRPYTDEEIEAIQLRANASAYKKVSK